VILEIIKNRRKKMQIEKCINGYIMIYPDGEKKVSHDIESIFSNMLHYFEGKCPDFYDDSYGRVDVSYERPDPRKLE
jgi:hypothetical protein